MIKFTLIGFPNTGKTSLFNKLTSSNFKTANFAGATTYAQNKILNINNIDLTVTDLPGIQSLSLMSLSQDELVVTKYIDNNPNDIYLNIVNIEQLERQLTLSLTLLNKGLKIIIIVNMIDAVEMLESQKQKIVNYLEHNLGVQVLLASSKNKNDVQSILNVISNITINSFNYLRPHNQISVNKINDKASIITKTVESIGRITNKSSNTTKILDKIFLNKFLGIPLFIFVMYAIFSFVMYCHSTFGGLIAENVDNLFSLLDSLLNILPAYKWSNLIITQGLGSGISTMLSFIPIVLSLFICLNLLEKTGYMARQAFLVDGVMQKLGLPGKAFISLIMGLGCTAACATGCRTLERESDRKLSLMMSPSLSCSAKLPVYIFLSDIFFSMNSAFIVVMLYLIGIVFAVVNGMFLSKSLFNHIAMPFIMEIPNYRTPNIIEIVKDSLGRLKSFVIGLGKTIVPLIIIITIFNNIDFTGKLNSNNTNNILPVVSKFITPALEPMGISNNNWEATFSLITGFLAKEVVAGTLDSLYFTNTNTSEEKSAILHSKFESNDAMFAFLLFVLLYSPCISAMIVIKNEIGKLWAWVVGLWSTWNAFAVASIYYQLSINNYNAQGFINAGYFILIYIIIFIVYKYLGNKFSKQWQSNFIVTHKTK